MNRWLLPLVTVAMVSTAACDSNSSSPAPGDSTQAGDSLTAGDPWLGDPDQGDPNIRANSCDELGTTSCFANHECPADRRCQSVGATPGEVVCCVLGARGTAPVGTSCAGQNGEFFCQSGLCIGDGSVELCSTVCTSTADCPVGMKRCLPIAFSTSVDNWCFPE